MPTQSSGPSPRVTTYEVDIAVRPFVGVTEMIVFDDALALTINDVCVLAHAKLAVARRLWSDGRDSNSEPAIAASSSRRR